MNREEFEQKQEIRRWKVKREAHKSSDTIKDYHEEKKLKEELEDGKK